VEFVAAPRQLVDVQASLLPVEQPPAIDMASATNPTVPTLVSVGQRPGCVTSRACHGQPERGLTGLLGHLDGRLHGMLATVLQRILEARPKSRMFVMGPVALAAAMVFVLIVGKSSALKSAAPFVLVLALLYVAWGVWPGPRRP
jgi:hypothetical protein